MVYVNFLANALPINNRSTGEISDSYPNLFAPFGFTFAIWGVIYIFLGLFVLNQFLIKKENRLFRKINLLFILTCILNVIWIFSWHYDFIALSVIIMLGLFFTLMKIVLISQKEKFLISTPFSIYFGWISIALIANIAVFLVSISWNGFGIPDYIWTVIVLIIGSVIGVLRLIKDKDIAYGLVFVWAYFGILSKHLSSDGFNFNFPSIVYTLIVSMLLFLFFIFESIKHKG